MDEGRRDVDVESEIEIRERVGEVGVGVVVIGDGGERIGCGEGVVYVGEGWFMEVREKGRIDDGVKKN